MVDQLIRTEDAEEKARVKQEKMKEEGKII